MERELPSEVLRRPKTPATCDPAWDKIRRSRTAALIPAFELAKYVDLTRVPDPADQDMMTFWVDLRARALNYWLRNMQGKATAVRPAKVKESTLRGFGLNYMILSSADVRREESMKDKDKKEQLPDTKRSKKAYRQPRLQVYGDLRDDYSSLSMCSCKTRRTQMKVDKTSA